MSFRATNMSFRACECGIMFLEGSQMTNRQQKGNQKQCQKDREKITVKNLN